MREIRNIIDYADDGKHRERDFEKLKGIAIHRCGVDLRTGVTLGYSAPDVLDAFLGRREEFSAVAKATGSENAYSIYIGGKLGEPEFDGQIWQALPLSEVGYHARRFSAPYLGIGMIGDFRVQPSSTRQYNSLIWLLTEICRAFTFDPYKCVSGHGELKNAHDGSKAPGKPNACPGDLLVMNHVRDDTAVEMREAARQRLHESGLVFE